MKFGGQDLTRHLMNLLSEERYCNIRDEHFEDINKIKEKKCSVAYDFDVSLKGGEIYWKNASSLQTGENPLYYFSL